MKVQVQVLVPVTICVSVVLLGIIKVRKTEQDREDKRSRFQDTKLRVTYDVLREYQGEKVEMQKLLDKTDIAKKALEQEVNMLKAKADKAKADADICQGNKKSARDGTGKIEAEFNNLKAEKDKEAARWKAEVETLKQKLEGRSKVCDYVKKESSAASKLCSNVVIVDNPKKEEPKVEAPKKEEPKKEAPKAEAPKKT